MVVTQDALDYLTDTTHGKLVGYHTNWRDAGATQGEIPGLVHSAMAARDQFGIEPTLVLGETVVAVEVFGAGGQQLRIQGQELIDVVSGAAVHVVVPEQHHGPGAAERGPDVRARSRTIRLPPSLNEPCIPNHAMP